MGIALLLLGGVAAVVGSLMLVVAAFRTGVLWGLACLLIPFAALVYLVLHWDEARTGFLLNLAGLAVAALGLLFLPTDALWGGSELASGGWQEPAAPAWEQPESPPAGAWEQPGREPGGRLAGFPGSAPDGGGSPLAGGEAPPPALEANPTGPNPALPRREEVLHPSSAGGHLGRLMVVVQHDGKSFKARLRAVRDGVLYFERPVGGGSVTFPMPTERILELRVTPVSR